MPEEADAVGGEVENQEVWRLPPGSRSGRFPMRSAPSAQRCRWWQSGGCCARLPRPGNPDPRILASCASVGFGSRNPGEFLLTLPPETHPEADARGAAGVE